MSHDDTSTDEAQSIPCQRSASAGVVVVVVAAKPTLRVVLYEDRPIIVGRGEGSSLVLDDKRLSRAHAELSRDAHGWRVRDLCSHNGTKIDGQSIPPSGMVRGSVVRVGDSLLLLEDDISRFGRPHTLFDPKRVVGPALQGVIDQVGRAAQNGLHVLLLGESGAGKEVVASAFHAASPFPSGPFRTLNCSSLPEGVLEDELFGHVRGAFSGASNERAGLFESAHKGTLFLDEIGDMPLSVQAKVLRAVENGEVRRIGENTARHVRVQIVSATNHPLRDRVGSGAFRADLFHRIAQTTVEIPPLRARREEIPFFVALALREAGSPPVEGSLFEQCLLRPWLGNVRELLGAVRGAATAALAGTALRGKHLDPQAGYAPASARPANHASLTPPTAPLVPPREEVEQVVIDLARRGLANEEIAARVGISATSVYRYLRKHGLGKSR